jgi:hypothetical protein
MLQNKVALRYKTTHPILLVPQNANYHDPRNQGKQTCASSPQSNYYYQNLSVVRGGRGLYLPQTP